jgi:hypothetical protein
VLEIARKNRKAARKGGFSFAENRHRVATELKLGADRRRRHIGLCTDLHLSRQIRLLAAQDGRESSPYTRTEI